MMNNCKEEKHCFTSMTPTSQNMIPTSHINQNLHGRLPSTEAIMSRKITYREKMILITDKEQKKHSKIRKLLNHCRSTTIYGHCMFNYL